MSRRIDVLLVDDHPVVRDGIASMLEAAGDICVCGRAAAGLEAIELAAELRPRITVMDIGLPDISGFEATRRIIHDTPAARVLILTVHDNKEYVLRAARVGARGYLVKNSSADQLLEAIERVDAGRLYYPDALLEDVRTAFAQGDGDDEDVATCAADLSQREREVLVLIADGLSNREVAERLDVGVRTVETHRERLMSKLHIRSVAGLTKYAISEGLIRLD